MTVRQMQIYAALCVWAYCEAMEIEHPGVWRYIDHLLSIAFIDDVVDWDGARVNDPEWPGDDVYHSLSHYLPAEALEGFVNVVTHATEIGIHDMFTMDSIGPASELARVKAVLQRYNIPLPDPEPTLCYCVAGEIHRHWGDTVTEAELNELLAIYKYPAPDLR